MPHSALKAGLLLLSLSPTLSQQYHKPAVSSESCVKLINTIADRTHHFGMQLACVGCDPANEACAPGCQLLVDQYYRACAGVTLPDGLFYDPAKTLAGSWENAELYLQVKIAVERCGCNAATGLRAPPLALLLAMAAAVWLLAGAFH